MADEIEFVVLTCPNCGGKLEIYNETDRFACSFCGGEILVQGRGGAVS
jgi:DNA-directed RNA polymerase subunit RPC12/RpoP